MVSIRYESCEGVEITKGEQKRANISFLSDSHKTRGNPFPLQVQSAAKCSAVIGLVSLPAARDNKEWRPRDICQSSVQAQKAVEFRKRFLLLPRRICVVERLRFVWSSLWRDNDVMDLLLKSKSHLVRFLCFWAWLYFVLLGKHTS